MSIQIQTSKLDSAGLKANKLYFLQKMTKNKFWNKAYLAPHWRDLYRVVLDEHHFWITAFRRWHHFWLTKFSRWHRLFPIAHVWFPE